MAVAYQQYLRSSDKNLYYQLTPQRPTMKNDTNMSASKVHSLNCAKKNKIPNHLS